MSELTLFVDSLFHSPWAMSAFVALEEKGLPHRLEVVKLGQGDARLAGNLSRTGRVPALRHGDYWLAESTAIAEYLAETFPFPKHPRLFPENLQQRGICRELQAWLRSDLAPIRSERSTTMVWWKRKPEPLSAAAQATREKIIAALDPLIKDGQTTLFEAWCIADADVAVLLQRMNLNGDALPKKLVAYAEANWARPSIAKWNAMPRPASPD